MFVNVYVSHENAIMLVMNNPYNKAHVLYFLQ